MEKVFLIKVDNMYDLSVKIFRTTKLIKIKNFLEEKFPYHEIRLFIDFSTEIKVFSNNYYDNISLESIWDQINDPYFLLTKIENKIENIDKKMENNIDENKMENIDEKTEDEKMENIENNIEEYNLEDVIGKGGHSEVYRAINKNTKKEVAIKIIKKGELNDELLKKELLLHSKFKHPNIINLEVYFEDKENMYIVMEICGKTLAEYEKEHKKIYEHVAFSIIKQISLGLKYLHDQGYVHRDIKPENIIQCGSTWKIIDFGYTEKEQDFSDFKGTLDFVAPEMIFTDRYGGKYKGKPTDIWALGVLFYELLERKTPFESHSYKKTYENIVNKHVNDTIPLINLMLKKEPRERININQVLSYL
jgi:tRNA A-37 threonylcarbamoyl transferase component Bud32